MPFDPIEIEKMQSIFKHLEPKTLSSPQLYKSKTVRFNCTFYIENTRKEKIYIFQYFEKLSPYRRKLLAKRKKEIAHQIYIVELENNSTCIGWKC